ncbi:unnamed protein product [Urochloa decumbens]|uniref:F-box domain-containing protein n=1 Tax=Urochloa decumbens TaxID=240449 RepID=A0ABC9GBS4_9POAL
MAAPPPLPDVLVEEILVRHPPDDPASLLRAALACKRWARLVSGPGFRHRLRDFHRWAPMLGFLCDLRNEEDGGATSRFMPASTFRPRHADRRGWRTADVRHGRVLLYLMRSRFAPFRNVFSVWIPVTGELRELPKPPRPAESWGAAVLCGAGAANGECGHHPGCHSGPFRVVFVGTDSGGIFSCVYSSVDDAWMDAKILRYDLPAREVSVIERPPTCYDFQGRALLMSMEDGRLGFASVHYYGLRMWTREVGADGERRWAPTRAISLAKLLPTDALLAYPCLVAFADDVELLFVWTALGGLFLVNLKSGQVRSVVIGSDFYGIIPFVSYYVPGTTLLTFQIVSTSND